MLRSVRCARFRELFTAVEHGVLAIRRAYFRQSPMLHARSARRKKDWWASAGALSGLCHNSVINAANLFVSCPLNDPPSAAVS
jgi:hypothetical protein